MTTTWVAQARAVLEGLQHFLQIPEVRAVGCASTPDLLTEMDDALTAVLGTIAEFELIFECPFCRQWGRLTQLAGAFELTHNQPLRCGVCGGMTLVKFEPAVRPRRPGEG